jgi:DNA-binding response OmpR family regulator
MPNRILIIDDDVELCELLRDYLAAEGFAVEAVHDGESGAERVKGHDYCLVVLDVMLP